MRVQGRSDFAAVNATAAAKRPDQKHPFADRPIVVLTKAAKGGWKDPDFNPLLNRNDLRELLADPEAKFPPRKETLPLPRAGD